MPIHVHVHWNAIIMNMVKVLVWKSGRGREEGRKEEGKGRDGEMGREEKC